MLYLGPHWPAGAPMRAALMIVADAVCGLIALGLYGATLLTGQSPSTDLPDAQPKHRHIHNEDHLVEP